MKIDFRPVSQELYHITHSTPELFEGEMWLGKGKSGPPLHIHPQQQEDLELVSGKLKIFRNEKWEVIEAGTRWIIPAGEVHTFQALPDAEATVNFKITPAGNFEGFLKDTEALIRSGKLKSYESLNGIIYSSMLVKKYKDTMQPALMPMKIAMFLATMLGRIQGKKV